MASGSNAEAVLVGNEPRTTGLIDAKYQNYNIPLSPLKGVCCIDRDIRNVWVVLGFDFANRLKAL